MANKAFKNLPGGLDGYYRPGSPIQVHLTWVDGAGAPLDISAGVTATIGAASATVTVAANVTLLAWTGVQTTALGLNSSPFVLNLGAVPVAVGTVTGTNDPDAGDLSSQTVMISSGATITITVGAAISYTASNGVPSGGTTGQILRKHSGTNYDVEWAAALGTIATQNADAVNIAGGTIAGITDLAIADGGTGASTAAGARTNLGLAAIAVSGSASDLTAGSVPAARFGNLTIPLSALNMSGTPSSTNFPRGDGTWASAVAQNQMVVYNAKDAPYSAAGNSTLSGGGTDDTAAIQAAADAAYAAGGVLYVPPGIFRLTSTLTINGAHVIDPAATLVVDHNGVGVKVGPSASYIYNAPMFFDGALRKITRVWTNSLSVGTLSSDIGIQYRCCYSCRIRTPYARGFSTNIHFAAGTGLGFVYNQVDLGFSLYGGICYLVQPAISSGWVNQNTFRGGRSSVDDTVSASGTSVNTGTDQITATAHGLLTGDKVVLTATALPSPLVAGTVYFAIKIDANTIKLATNASNAAGGTAIDLTTSGTGTIAILGRVQVSTTSILTISAEPVSGLNNPNGNTFIGFSFEGEADEYALSCTGYGNVFISPRTEAANGYRKKIRWHAFTGASASPYAQGNHFGHGAANDQADQVVTSPAKANSFDTWNGEWRGYQSTTGGLFLFNASNDGYPVLKIFDAHADPSTANTTTDYSLSIDSGALNGKVRTDSYDRIRLDLANGQLLAGAGSAAPTVAGARSALGVDKRSTFSNAAYAAAATDKYIGQTGTMSASRALTLPAANAVNAGYEIIVADESGSVTATNTIVITRAGSDTINGQTTHTLTQPYSWVRLVSNGSNAWLAELVDVTILPFSAAGNLVASTTYGHRFYVSAPYKILAARVGVGTAPTGSAATFDILKNGSTIFSSLPSISASAFDSGLVTSLSTTTLAAGDYIQVKVTTAGATIAGADPTWQLHLQRI